MNKPLILFGAGYVGNEYFHSISSDDVYCFADNYKFGQTFCGKKVISFNELKSIHSDYNVVLTVSPKYQMELAHQCTDAGIVCSNLEKMHWRKGCFSMQNQLLIDPNLKICCQTYPKTKIINPTGNWISDYNAWKSYKQSLISSLIKGESCDCDGCTCLTEGFWQDTPELTEIRLGGRFEGERCNARCIYCSFTKEGRNVLTGEFNVMEPLEALSDVIVDGIDIIFLSAEITISPFKEQFFNFIRNKNLRSSVFFTSGIVFSNDVAEMLRGGRLCISLDCGTEETYKKIKGVDAFNVVKKNIERYSKYCDNIQLKYIILDGYNDNYEDIDGFLEICRQFSNNTLIAVDFNTQDSGVSENIFSCIEYFVKRGKLLNQKVTILPLPFNNNDYARVKKIIGG